MINFTEKINIFTRAALAGGSLVKFFSFKVFFYPWILPHFCRCSSSVNYTLLELENNADDCIKWMEGHTLWMKGPGIVAII